MADSLTCWLMFRLGLPLSLIAAISFRYNGMSVVYLIFLLLLPLCRRPNLLTMKGSFGQLLRAVTYSSFAFLVVQVASQIAFNYLLPQDFLWKEVLNHFGFLRFNNLDAGNIIRLLAPDVGLFLTGLTITRLWEKIMKRHNQKIQLYSESQDRFSGGGDDEEAEEEGEMESEAETEDGAEDDETDGSFETDSLGRSQSNILLKLTLYLEGLKILCEGACRAADHVVAVLLLGTAGIILPSAASAVYFLIFLGLCSWWSCHRRISPDAFHSLYVLIAIFSAGHLFVLYLYQLPFFQDLVPPEDIHIRVLGIVPLVKTNRTALWKLQVHPQLTWPVGLNPFALFALYCTLVELLQQGALLDKESKEKGIQMQDETCRERKVEADLWLIMNEKGKVVSASCGSSRDVLLSQSQSQSSCYMDACPNEGHAISLSEETTCPEDTTEMDEERSADGKRSSTFLAVLPFLMNHSYIGPLIAALAWSITHNSWLTFILLIWSCIIWMVRKRRFYALQSSPFLVGYGNALVVLNFFVGLNVSQDELFPGVPTSLLTDLDLKPYSLPCVHLGVKILYLFTFWLLLKQHMIERQRRSKEEEESLQDVTVDEAEMDKPQNPLWNILASVYKGMLVKYWIYFCSIMFFIVSFSGKVVLYKILYTVLFLLCVALYEVHYEMWRRTLKVFWLTVVTFSMVVLIVIYTYQFEMVSSFYLNTLKISEERLKDVGLERFNTLELFARILLPGAFLLACILQLHYFHNDFLRITDLTSVSIRTVSSSGRDKKMEAWVYSVANALKETILAMKNRLVAKQLQDGLDPSDNTVRKGQQENLVEKMTEWQEVVDGLAPRLLEFLTMVRTMQAFAWRFLELHILKIVSAWSIWVIVQEVSLMNFPFLIAWAFALPYSKLRPLTLRICVFWSSMIVICKMIYQLKFVKPLQYSSNCTQRLQLNTTYHATNAEELLEKSSLYAAPVDPAHWVGGLMKCNGSVFPYLKNHLAILLLTALEATVHRHQLYYRIQNQLPPPPTGSLFHDITRDSLEDSLLSCIKYFINYVFYKFGLEVCFVAAINVIRQRMDIYALVYAVWLIYLLSFHRRKAVAEVWPKYCCFLASIMVFQYLLCIGLPPALCQDYPWRTSHWVLHSDLIKWLYLPDFAKRPDARFLLFDFLLLLTASLQWQVFKDENTFVVRVQAGDNIEISRDLDPARLSQCSPVPNFIHCRSYLDLAKVLVFRYHFWFALCLIFMTGTKQINVFCMGYLAACFYFTLFGRNLQLKPVKDMLRPWDHLIAYTTLVIATKNLLAIVACAYISKLQRNHCWLIQTFGMFCTIPGYDADHSEEEVCEQPGNETGIVWDATCFTFLLVQRRIFMSYYYLYVVADFKAAKILASRGTELFEAKLRKMVAFRMHEDKHSMEVMKRKVELLKPKQNDIDRSEKGTTEAAKLEDPEDAASRKEEEEKKTWWQPWVTHTSMIQDGSYCLFETDSEEEEDQECTEKTEEDSPKKKTAFQLAYEAWITSSQSALRMREQDEIRDQKNKEEERHQRWQQQQMLSSGKAKVKMESCEENLVTGDNLGKTESIGQRVINIVKFLWVFSQALSDDTKDALNSLCKDHLDIANVLRIEKCMLWREIEKASADSVLRRDNCETSPPACNTGTTEMNGNLHKENTEPLLSRRSGKASAVATGKEMVGDQSSAGGSTQQFPWASSSAEIAHFSSSALEAEESTDFLFPRSKEAGRLLNNGSVMRTASELLLNRTFHDDELEQSDRFYESLPRPLKLGVALYNVMVSKSELLCYFVIILNHTLSASISTLVLPILIFLWAMLSIPRPTKFFWMTAIIYTEVTFVIKYFSQFGFFPWTTKLYCALNAEKPFALPNMAGIEKQDVYMHYDLVQLLALFFHRYILKCYGLWDSKQIDVPDCEEKSRTGRPKKKKAHRGQLKESRPRSRAQQPFRSQHLSRNIAKSTNEDKPLKEAKKKWNLFRKFPAVRKRITKETINLQIQKAKELPIKIALQIYRPIKQFFYDIIHPECSPICDVYALMFLADVINFIIIIFGYWAFGKYSSAAADITEIFSEDRVPDAFLVMLLVQFGTMIVDRAIYLRKNMFGKCVFQVVLVFSIHFWMFFILPQVTERRFNRNAVAQLWYLVKCVYFGLSAYQIKCGYPKQVLGNFLTKSYNCINLFLFEGFRMVPFLTELRAVMDWVWTDTTLSLSSWICVEDIYANVFILKCWRESEKKYPQPPGQKKKMIVKYGMGGAIVLVLICIVWFPLLAMSLATSVAGVTNQPLDVSIKITISGYESLFTMSAQQQNLVPFTQAAYDDLTIQYALQPSAMQFIVNYGPKDIVVAKIKGNASLLWTISPASRKSMIAELSNSSAIYINFYWTLLRNASLVKNIEASGIHTVRYEEKEIREQIVQVLCGTRTDPVLLPGVLPRYLRATSGAEAKMAHRLQVAHSRKLKDIDKLAFFRNITIELQQLPTEGSVRHIPEWWIVKEHKPGCLGKRCSKNMEIFIFNDKVSPSTLGFIASQGIVGLYMSFVLVIGKFIREFFNGISRSIMFEELPNVDRVLKLCSSIFLAREAGELELEEQLFAKLIFLYRSPETMIKWTRKPKPKGSRRLPLMQHSGKEKLGQTVEVHGKETANQNVHGQHPHSV